MKVFTEFIINLSELDRDYYAEENSKIDGNGNLYKMIFTKDGFKTIIKKKVLNYLQENYPVSKLNYWEITTNLPANFTDGFITIGVKINHYT